MFVRFVKNTERSKLNVAELVVQELRVFLTGREEVSHGWCGDKEGTHDT